MNAIALFEPVDDFKGPRPISSATKDHMSSLFACSNLIEAVQSNPMKSEISYLIEEW